MKISIITPAYNASQNVDLYMESLIDQNSSDFELIVIDDCSTDDTYKKLAKYKEKTEFDFIIKRNKVNKGPGESRNVGLDISTGDFVMFLDSDDYLESVALEEIERNLYSNVPDCLIFDFVLQKGRKRVLKKSLDGFSQGFLPREEALAFSLGAVAGKVYRRSVIEQNNIRFPNIIRFEDFVFNKTSISKCSKIYYLDKPLYVYNLHPKSIVHLIENQNHFLPLQAYQLVESNIDKRKYSMALNYMFIRDVVYSSTVIMASNNKYSKKDMLEWFSYLEIIRPGWALQMKDFEFSLNQKIVLQSVIRNKTLLVRLVSWLKKIFR